MYITGECIGFFLPGCPEIKVAQNLNKQCNIISKQAHILTPSLSLFRISAPFPIRNFTVRT